MLPDFSNLPPKKPTFFKTSNGPVMYATIEKLRLTRPSSVCKKACKISLEAFLQITTQLTIQKNPVYNFATIYKMPLCHQVYILFKFVCSLH